MSRQGAILQDQNIELVKCIEDLRERLETLETEIKADEARKAELERDWQLLEQRLRQHDESLQQKYAQQSQVQQTLNDAQAAYAKIIDSSKALLDVLRKESSHIHCT